MVAPGSTAARLLADFNQLPGSRIPSVESQETAMGRAWDAYTGTMPDPFVVKPNQPNDNLKFNGASIIVDTGVAFLFGRGFEFTLDGDDATRSPAESYLDAVWQANNRNQLLHKLAINGGVCGQAFVKIYPALPYPRLYAIDPAKMTVVTAADDPGYALQYIIRWSGLDKATGAQVDFRQVISRAPLADDLDSSVQAAPTEAWTIVDQKAVSQPRMFREDLIKWVEIGREAWPYPFPPIVDCQNLSKPNSYFGKADLSEDVIHLIDKINRTLSNIAKILRIHAHPRTWSRGLTDTQIKQLNVDVERIINLPGDTATLQNLEMESDLASSITFYWSLRQALYELTRVPEIASGKITDLQYMSAMAMQILYGPLIEKTNAKRLTYGDGLIAELHRRLLILAGMDVPPQPTHIVWPEVFPRDALTESQTAMNLVQIGVSQDTLLEGMGYNPAKERTRRAVDLKEEVAKTKALAAVGGQPGAPASQGAKQPPQGQTVPAKTGNPNE